MNEREKFRMRYTRTLILLTMLALLGATAVGQSARGADAPQASPKAAGQDVAAFFESLERGDAAAVRRFLAQGMSPHAIAPLSGGEVALLRAVGLGHAEVVEALIEAGADVNLKDEHDGGSSPLKQAVVGGHLSVVRVLLKHHADVNYGDEDGHTNLLSAALAAAASVLPPEALLFINPDAESTEDVSPGSVPRQDRLEIVRLLLAAGADVNLRAEDCGLNALTGAAALGDAEVVRLLLAAGADPNVWAGPFNPLKLAAMTREQFLQQVADEEGDAEPDERTRQIAADFFDATRRGRAEVVLLLRQAGAREP
jgi:ankyrin repeat protein